MYDKTYQMRQRKEAQCVVQFPINRLRMQRQGAQVRLIEQRLHQLLGNIRRGGIVQHQRHGQVALHLLQQILSKEHDLLREVAHSAGVGGEGYMAHALAQGFGELLGDGAAGQGYGGAGVQRA